MQGFEAQLNLKPDARPKFCRPRSVPFAIKGAIDQELDRMESSGILVKVSSSDWAAPIVPVPKKDGQFRICGDYKVSVNPVMEIEQYPLPKPQELFATLAGGWRFTKLDLTQAYLQLPLDEESRRYTTINTQRGLYQSVHTSTVRHCFGTSSISEDHGHHATGYSRCHLLHIDDILISSSTDAEHLHALSEVFERLHKHGMRLKKPKCLFMQSSVEFLGHLIDVDGLHPTQEKLRAVLQAPAPRNSKELRSFLGLIHYYGSFIANLASLLHPLNRLLQHGCPWNWTPECERAFHEAKERLTSSQVLVHYDPLLPIRVAADASAYGLGAVLSHVQMDGSERPVAFASRVLTSSERNYAQALALIFAVKKFHTYLYGRKFSLITDHQPLLSIFGPKKGIPPLAAARLQRSTILLSAYTYDIE